MAEIAVDIEWNGAGSEGRRSPRRGRAINPTLIEGQIEGGVARDSAWR